MKWRALIGLLTLAVADAAEKPVFDADRGCWQATLLSGHQAAPVKVEIIPPKLMEPGKTYPVLHILPVEAGDGHRFGDGLMEARKAEVAEKYGVICVSPSFVEIPWYGNHATDPKIRQEDFMVKTLVPWIEETYPARREKEGRLLIGFSKSGWGAFTLLLRNPEVFGYAAAWDAPFLLDGEGKDWGPMGIRANFGTKEAFLDFLPSELAGRLPSTGGPRLVLGPGIDWKKQSVGMHELLQKRKVPHVYREDLLLAHRWDSGWFAPMVKELMRLAAKQAGR